MKFGILGRILIIPSPGSDERTPHETKTSHVCPKCSLVEGVRTSRPLAQDLESTSPLLSKHNLLNKDSAFLAWNDFYQPTSC